MRVHGAEQASRESLGRVLLVTDDQKRLDRHAFLMQALRFDCKGALGLREAMGQVEQHDPNLIFIDLRDDGETISASRRLKRQCDGMVSILVTLPTSDVPSQQRAAEAGADDFIVHPVNEVDLIFKLRTAMRHAKQMQALQRTNVRLDALLRSHVGGPLVDHWLAEGADDAHELTGRTVVVTILFADINGFTRMSSEWPADRTVTMLNEMLTLCTLPLVDYGATVDKYIGDCVMAYFGPAEEQPDHALRAVRAALAMQRSIQQWVAHAEHIHGRINVSIGLNSGSAVLGNTGSTLRLDHTVIGDAVNVAARLQDLAPDGGIYAGPLTVRATTDHFAWKSHGEQQLKGRAAPIETFELKHDLSVGH